MLAEVKARQIPKKELAWGSTADWFTHLAGTTRGKGHRTVQQAPILVGERTATHAAMLAGRVSPEQAAVIVTAVEKLPLNAAVRDHAEAVLLGEAARLNATDLGRGRQAPGRAGRPRQGGAGRREGAGPGGPGRPPRPLPLHQRGRCRRRPAPGPRHRRGRRPAQGRPAAAHQAAAGRGRRGPGLRGRAGPARPRRPDVGRPRPTCRARAGHRPAPGLPRRPAPGHRHHVPGRAPAADRLGHPRQLGVDHRRRPRARPLGGPPAGLRRRHHPRRPRRQGRGPRRRPPAPAGHPAALASRRLPRPALRLPRLHQAPDHVPRPPHHPLGSTAARPSSRTSSSSAASTTASSTTPPGRSGSTPTTADPSSSPHPDADSHHPTGSEADHDASRNSQGTNHHPSQKRRRTRSAAPVRPAAPAGRKERKSEPRAATARNHSGQRCGGGEASDGALPAQPAPPMKHRATAESKPGHRRKNPGVPARGADGQTGCGWSSSRGPKTHRASSWPTSSPGCPQACICRRDRREKSAR